MRALGNSFELPTTPGARPPGGSPFRYWRLWRLFLAVSLMRQMEYRAGFALALLASGGRMALLLATYLVFYSFTPEVAGWTADQALLVLAMFWVFDGVWSALFTANLRQLGDHIQDGRLDFLLLRPASSQFLVSCGTVQVWEGAGIAAGLALLVVAGGRAGVHLTPGNVALALGFGLCGLAILYALRFAAVAWTFWALRVGELYALLSSTHDAARFPVTYFERPLRDVLTYVLPVAFATTFPASALLGRADARLLPIGVMLAALALLASHLLWQRGLRRYTSASGF